MLQINYAQQTTAVILLKIISFLKEILYLFLFSKLISDTSDHKKNKNQLIPSTETSTTTTTTKSKTSTVDSVRLYYSKSKFEEKKISKKNKIVRIFEH